MKGFMRQRGAAWELRVYLGHDPLTGKKRYATRTVRGVVQFESCSYSDRQMHTTPTTEIWEGYYDYNEQWQNIWAVAGGSYAGQWFFRRGRYTKALGTISGLHAATVGAGGDCLERSVTGYALYNASGSPVQGGDSGGPLVLAYGGKWYIAGITSTTGPSGSSGRSAIIAPPAGWTVCTQQFYC